MSRPYRKYLNPDNLLRRGVAKKFFETTIEDFNTGDSEELEEVKDFVRDYLDNLESMYRESIGILFRGSNGVGKSMLASLIVKEAYRRYYTSMRVTFIGYMAKYTELWNIKNQEDKEEAEGIFYSDYKGVDFLVLEEIGKEVDSKVAVPILEDLLRYREEKGKPTIICTNLDSQDIEEKYGKSIMSIIKGNMTPVVIVGEDKRIKVFKEAKKRAKK